MLSWAAQRQGDAHYHSPGLGQLWGRWNQACSAALSLSRHGGMGEQGTQGKCPEGAFGQPARRPLSTPALFLDFLGGAIHRRSPGRAHL